MDALCMEMCTKCTSTVLNKCYGYSQEDQYGERYEYLHCPTCGFVKHLYNQHEMSIYVRERIQQLGEVLRVTVAYNDDKTTRAITSTLGPK
jgi:hypothetical protein